MLNGIKMKKTYHSEDLKTNANTSKIYVKSRKEEDTNKNSTQKSIIDLLHKVILLHNKLCLSIYVEV